MSNKNIDIINKPSHYGADIPHNPYEIIKIREALDLGLHKDQALKYICRAGKKAEEKKKLKT